MDSEKSSTQKHVQNAGNIGPIWFIGWLFTIGFVQLSFWKAVLVLIIWPYYLGDFVATL